MVRKALEADSKADVDLLVVARVEGNEMVALRGSDYSLCKALGLAMIKDNNVMKVITKSAKIFNDFRDENPRDEKPRDCRESSKEDPLPKCKNCDIRDSCPILNEDVDPLKALINLLGNLQERVHKKDEERK